MSAQCQRRSCDIVGEDRESNAAVVAFDQHLGFELMPRVVMGRWLG